MNNHGRVVLALLIAVVAVPLFAQSAQPQLRVFVDVFPNRLDPGQTSFFRLYLTNEGAVAATNVVLTATVPAGGTMIGVNPSGTDSLTCAMTSNTLTCHSQTLQPQQNIFVEITFVAPESKNGGDFIVNAKVTSNEADADPGDNESLGGAAMVRHLTVTNVADEGTGSLRQAIHDVNALCPFPKPCAIDFEIPAPVPESGWFTIQPRTQFPEIAASIRIDGRTQTAFTGDTNPDGPEIEINGWLVPEGSGLRVRPECDTEVRNLAVNGFPGYGIVIRRLGGDREPADPCILLPFSIQATVRENYLGVDPRGVIAKSNQRGLGLFVHESLVERNLIRGNRRAGIYAAEGFYTEIFDNRIVHNGAGIFFNMGETRFDNPGGADVLRNVIANNDGMAIARTRIGQILVTENSIFDNLGLGIDLDVDGVTPRRGDDRDVPNAPVLFSATYAPGINHTFIRGRLDSEASGNTRVIEIYASARLGVWATAQAETLIARHFVQSAHGEFEALVPGDLRGKWITATYVVSNLFGFGRTPRGGAASQSHRISHPADTSELSNAVFVH